MGAMRKINPGRSSEEIELAFDHMVSFNYYYYTYRPQINRFPTAETVSCNPFGERCLYQGLLGLLIPLLLNSILFCSYYKIYKNETGPQC